MWTVAGDEDHTVLFVNHELDFVHANRIWAVTRARLGIKRIALDAVHELARAGKHLLV
jgi:hypothetical protein